MTDYLTPPPRTNSSSRTPGPPASSSRTGLTLIFVALAAGAGLFLAWRTAGTLLLIFTGLLLASVLDACVRGIAYVLPIGRGWRLAIVCTLIVLGTAWLVVWGGYNLVDQGDELVRLIGDQLRRLRGELRSMGHRAAAEPRWSAHAGPASSPRSQRPVRPCLHGLQCRLGGPRQRACSSPSSPCSRRQARRSTGAGS